MPNGFSKLDWEAARNEAQLVLSRRVASSRPFISYSELVASISAIQLSAEDERLSKLLDEISVAESEAGRGMLSVIVVHKSGDKRPGAGFFKLGERLGRSTADREKFWAEEFAKVKSAWSSTDFMQRPTSGQLTKQLAGRSIETVPFLIPEYSKPSHPISRGLPKFHKLSALSDSVEGRTQRTEVFERILVGMFLRLGRPVPYAFYTSKGEIRSLDAGCIKFLLNRQSPEIDVICDSEDEVISVIPLPALVERYGGDDLLLREFSDNDIESELSFDIDADVDERRRIQSDNVRREGASAFRSSVLWAWYKRCAVTGTEVLCTIDAAHIYPYNGIKTNDPSNGIALRSDLHALFDNYFMSLRYAQDRLLLVLSRELRGTEYESLEKAFVRLPIARSHRPHPRLVEHHYKKFVDVEKGRSQ